MKLPTFHNFLPLLTSSIATEPVFTKRDAITSPYYLKTKAINGGDSTKDGLYVSAYSTGAGLNDAVLGDKAHALPGNLNNTYQSFNLSVPYPQTFFLASDTNHAGWNSVFINGGYGAQGLFLNDTGLQWTTHEPFDGWMACTWYHGIPQLFWKSAHYDYNISTCAQVELYPEAVDV